MCKFSGQLRFRACMHTSVATHRQIVPPSFTSKAHTPHNLGLTDISTPNGTLQLVPGSAYWGWPQDLFLARIFTAPGSASHHLYGLNFGEQSAEIYPEKPSFYKSLSCLKLYYCRSPWASEWLAQWQNSWSIPHCFVHMKLGELEQQHDGQSA